MEIEHPNPDQIAEQFLQEFTRDGQKRKTLLKKYYETHFPFEKIYNWLSYIPQNLTNHKQSQYTNWQRREISYVIPTTDMTDEFTIRHLCYEGWQDFKAEVQKYIPLRIDIGPICDRTPKNNRNENNLGDDRATAISREFVIDIDMSDYDAIRTCCVGKKICQKCWKYMVAAYEVLKASLEEDFGFSNILWVFSGRRGIHAWVSDERARVMENRVRSNMTKYLNVSVSNEKSDKLVKPQVIAKKEYKLFKRSFEILNHYFEDFVILEQEFLRYEKKAETIFKVFERHLKTYLKNKTEKIKREFFGVEGSLERWQILEITIENLKKEKMKESLHKQLLDHIDSFKYEVVLGLLYPKIDAHVSAQTNHLLKCPFNIHHGTGRVSVPLEDPASFKLDDVPTVEEITEGKKSLDGFIRIFDDFCAGVNEEVTEMHLIKEEMDKRTEGAGLEFW